MSRGNVLFPRDSSPTTWTSQEDPHFSLCQALVRKGLVGGDPVNATHVEAIARLHARLLGHSPIPQLGPLFMRRFYYSRLVEDGVICISTAFSSSGSSPIRNILTRS